ncbi:hypothetical protein HYT74_02540 [Candidatus Daviesbacteria bacterium]|nr:hypothetical protein [Candidatus Daviesbacteria bacterium]
MLERDFYLLQRRAQHQGFKKQVLAGAVRVGFEVAKVLTSSHYMNTKDPRNKTFFIAKGRSSH